MNESLINLLKEIGFDFNDINSKFEEPNLQEIYDFLNNVFKNYTIEGNVKKSENKCSVLLSSMPSGEKLFSELIISKEIQENQGNVNGVQSNNHTIWYFKLNPKIDNKEEFISNSKKIVVSTDAIHDIAQYVPETTSIVTNSLAQYDDFLIKNGHFVSVSNWVTFGNFDNHADKEDYRGIACVIDVYSHDDTNKIMDNIEKNDLSNVDIGNMLYEMRENDIISLENRIIIDMNNISNNLSIEAKDIINEKSYTNTTTELNEEISLSTYMKIYLDESKIIDKVIQSNTVTKEDEIKEQFRGMFK